MKVKKLARKKAIELPATRIVIIVLELKLLTSLKKTRHAPPPVIRLKGIFQPLTVMTC